MLGLDELRAYLQQSGIALWQVRKALLPLHAATIPQQVAVASERFMLAPHAVEIITAPDFIAAPLAWNTAAPATDLAPVLAFTHAASINYDQLFELLSSVWVQGGLGVAIQGINDLCDTSIQTLGPSPLDAGFLDRANRFALWRNTGYTIWQLDMLIQSAAVVNKTLDANGLIVLANFQLLQDAYRLTANTNCAWFQDIDMVSRSDPKQPATSALFNCFPVQPSRSFAASPM